MRVVDLFARAYVRFPRYIRGIRVRQSWWIAPASGAVVLIAIVILLMSTIGSQLPVEAASTTPVDPVASSAVHEVIDLQDANLHPQQLAYDSARNGIWFWTSTQQFGTQFDNRIYFYDINHNRLSSWPLYDGDWSSQLHAGLAVAPTGDIWVGWNHNLILFHPATGTYDRYILPQSARYPLPAAVIRDLPADLGITDLIVGSNGTVWIARYAALSLTAFDPVSKQFAEIPLPRNAGDPAKLALGPDGRIFFVTNLSADHPGYGGEKVGDYDPQTGLTHVYQHGALTLAVTPHGDLYTALSGQGPGAGLALLASAQRQSAEAQNQTPVFQQPPMPFDTDDRAMATDTYGRIWVAVGGQPLIAVYDPATGSIRQYEYPASPITVFPPQDAQPGVPRILPRPGAVWLTHVVAMVTDSQGHLWFIRAESDVIEEVAA